MCNIFLAGVPYKFKVKGDIFTFKSDELSSILIQFERIKASINAVPVWYITKLEIERGLLPISHVLEAINFLKKTYGEGFKLQEVCSFDLDY
jgi:hypothetical protein